VVQLLVNNATQNSAPATVTITAGVQVLPPVANAGPNQAVAVGQLVTLDGSGSSDPGGHLLTYSWSFSSQPAGSTATLTNPTTAHPTFTADAAGNFVAQLIVNNGTQNSAPASVIIAATAANLPPVANAGPNQAVAVGSLVTLDGSKSSDPQGQALTYSWLFVSIPTGSVATLTNPTTVNPTFTADMAGVYVVGLTVSDGTLSSAQSNVPITAGSSGSGSSKCFIATAAFGSPMAQEVQTLRAFRDRSLLTNAPGRLLVSAYYAASPPLAQVIARHEWLRAATRVALRPLLWGVEATGDSPFLAIGMVGLVVGPLLPLCFRRSRKSRGARRVKQ